MSLRGLRLFAGASVWFWTANIPPVIAAYLILDHDTFVRSSLLYTVLASIVANIVGSGSWWQSLRVEEHQEKDADVQEVLDAITNPEVPHG